MTSRLDDVGAQRMKRVFGVDIETCAVCAGLSIAQAFAPRCLARGRKITQPALAFEYLEVLLQDHEHEVFSAVFIDSQHRVVRLEELFRGTIDSASVYPLEVIKHALACNAAAVILVHNHPRATPTGASPSD